MYICIYIYILHNIQQRRTVTSGFEVQHTSRQTEDIYTHTNTHTQKALCLTRSVLHFETTGYTTPLLYIM